MLIWVTGGYGAILMALLAAVLGRKWRRDRAEARARTRRRHMRESLAAADTSTDMVSQACSGSRAEQIDLHWVLSRLDRAELATLREALVASGTAYPISLVLADRLQSRGPADRALVALLLGHLSLPDASSQLARLAHDGDADVQLAACRALAECDTAAAASTLIELLEARALPPKRIVERLGARWAVPEILAALKRPDSAAVRGELARSLGLAGDPAAIPELAGLLPALDEEDRINATRALGELEGRAVAPLLVPMLKDSSWRVRAQAARSLGRTDPAPNVEALGRAMGDAAWWVRTDAAEALGHAGGVGQAVLERVAEGPDRYAAERASEALARFFPSEAAGG